MSRIFEHDHADEEELVVQILADVHRAIDRHFPELPNEESKRFASTEFSVEERTMAQQNPSRPSSVPETNDAVPITAAKKQNLDQKASDQPHSLAEYAALGSRPPSQFTNLEESLDDHDHGFTLEDSKLEKTRSRRPARGLGKRFFLLLVVLIAALAGYFYLQP